MHFRDNGSKRTGVLKCVDNLLSRLFGKYKFYEVGNEKLIENQIIRRGSGFSDRTGRRDGSFGSAPDDDDAQKTGAEKNRRQKDYHSSVDPVFHGAERTGFTGASQHDAQF